MFLVRTAFWAGLVVLLLPTDKAQQEHLMGFAQQKLQWAMTYCDREPISCERAGEVWALLVKKAEFGATLAAELIREGTSNKPGGSDDRSYAG